MSKDQLKNLILSFAQDVIFSYNDKEYCINPFSLKKFELGTQDHIFNFNSIDELMSANIFEGKCLNEISEIIIVY